MIEHVVGLELSTGTSNGARLNPEESPKLAGHDDLHQLPFRSRLCDDQAHRNMSTAAKTTLASTVAGTIGIIYLVHRQQETDRAVSGQLQTCDFNPTISLMLIRPCTKV